MRRKEARWATRVALAAAVLLLAAPQGRAQGLGLGEQPSRERMRGLQQRWLGGGQWWNNPEMVEALGLDEAARQQIDDEVYRTQQELITLRAEVERQSLELQRLLQAPQAPALGEIEAQVERFVSARGEVMKSEILLRAKIMHILTPEQRVSLERIHEERRRTFRERALAPRRQRDAAPGDIAPEPGPPDEPPPLP